MTKNREKSRKIIFGSELFEPNNEPNFRLYQNIDKNRKIILGSELSETNNEPTFRITPKKNDKKSRKNSKNYFWPRIMS